MIAFKLSIEPPTTTAQCGGKQARIVGRHIQFYKTKEQETVEALYVTLCKPHRPPVPLSGPVALAIDFVFPWRKGEPRRNRLMGRLAKTTKPDGGNMGKALEDCLTKAGFWHDDAQVADLNVTKAWGDRVGIYISIRPIGVDLPLLRNLQPTHQPKQ